MSTELCEVHRNYACRECWEASQPVYVRQEVPTSGEREVVLVGWSWWGVGTIRVVF